MARRRSAVGPPCGARGARALARRGVIRYGAAGRTPRRERACGRTEWQRNGCDCWICQSMCSKIIFTYRVAAIFQPVQGTLQCILRPSLGETVNSRAFTCFWQRLVFLDERLTTPRPQDWTRHGLCDSRWALHSGREDTTRRTGTEAGGGGKGLVWCPGEERAGQACYLRRGATGPAGVRTSRLWQAPCLARRAALLFFLSHQSSDILYKASPHTRTRELYLSTTTTTTAASPGSITGRSAG